MACWLGNHEWGWPRRRGGMDTQVCVNCGVSRTSQVQFRRDEREYEEISQWSRGRQAPPLKLAISSVLDSATTLDVPLHNARRSMSEDDSVVTGAGDEGFAYAVLEPVDALLQLIEHALLMALAGNEAGEGVLGVLDARLGLADFLADQVDGKSVGGVFGRYV